MTITDPISDLFTRIRNGLKEKHNTVSLPFSKIKYDVLTCLELIEHVPDPEKLIQDCISVTKNESDLFFSTLNRNLISYLISIVGAE